MLYDLPCLYPHNRSLVSHGCHGSVPSCHLSDHLPTSLVTSFHHFLLHLLFTCGYFFVFVFSAPSRFFFIDFRLLLHNLYHCNILGGCNDDELRRFGRAFISTQIHHGTVIQEKSTHCLSVSPHKKYTKT